MTDVETAPDSPLTMEGALASGLYRDLMTPKLAEGDPAFPFPGLTEHLGKRPVALVFGSYT